MAEGADFIAQDGDVKAGVFFLFPVRRTLRARLAVIRPLEPQAVLSGLLLCPCHQ